MAGKKRLQSKGKVFVGLSGGVDSSVSAALLKRQGYEVTGVFIKVWHPEFLPCTWRDERRDAMRVSAVLGIPLLTFDFEEVYKREVIDYMIREYEKGRTPNPDVMCNRFVKFGAFLEAAKEMGARYVATGHYAQNGEKEGKHALLAGADMEKDQSYFLWQLGQKELASVLFPIGKLRKEEVRALAHSFGLPTADKKDSQGLCFVGKLDMSEFLKQFLPAEEGAVLSPLGERIGVHEGARLYTLGQRHGFRIGAKTEQEAPRYVVAKDILRNTIVVSSEPLIDGGRTDVSLSGVHWIREEPVAKKAYGARIRYRQTLRRCRLTYADGAWQVRFAEPQTGIAPGQSIVVYEGDECLGGGVIA
jgi:tRNA-uridine 2-sulfurtransferase